MSSALDQSTSTYVTISSESKWKIEWLNSTSVEFLLPRLGMKRKPPLNGGLVEFIRFNKIFNPLFRDLFYCGGLFHGGLLHGGLLSDLEDTDNAHIPKVKAATWFKPIQEYERPATPEPEWTIPPNDFPEPENNWSNAYATSYQVLAKNKQEQMSRLYLALNGYKSGKAIFFSMLKRYRRTPSFRYLWTSCGTPTSSELSLPLLVFLQSTFSSSGTL
ncbi:hypothetical protein Tco_1270258 [Tanacetum coccineum]